MKRILLVLAVATLMAAMLCVGASPVLADADENEHNCLGVLVSGGNPLEFSDPPGAIRGDFHQDLAKQGINGERTTAINHSSRDRFANCGELPQLP